MEKMSAPKFGSSSTIYTRPKRAQSCRMSSTLDNPFAVFVLSLVAQWLAAYVGDFLGRKRRRPNQDEQKEFDTIHTATLTLLALIIGFTFSMAVTRYDQRKNYEEAEANAIGTEYVRVDLLPVEDAARVRQLLKQYLDQRIEFYETPDDRKVRKINADTEKLQAELWSILLPAASSQPNAVIALAVSGLNDVLNSQGYTQAAWWNRIPLGAWALMGLIAIASSLLIGFGERRKGMLLLPILPVIVSVSFLLIADIDSPRGGIIRVLPHNLIALSQTINAQ